VSLLDEEDAVHDLFVEDAHGQQLAVVTGLVQLEEQEQLPARQGRLLYGLGGFHQILIF
jgi:hypothetical protein